MKMKRIFLLVYCLSSFSLPLSAQTPPACGFCPFNLSLINQPTRPRAFFGPQLLSFVLPGFDQWYEGQVASGLFYSGVAVGGIFLTTGASDTSEEGAQSGSVDARDNRVRQRALGMQTYQAMGGMSAYASFRSAVRSQQANGKFLFLKHEETSADIFAAPFRFSFLTKSSTLIPVGVLFAIAAYTVIEDRKVTHTGDRKRYGYNASDFFYASAFSYNAGTHEEAVFRGWLMPMTQHYFDNEFWSNTLTATLFAAAHLNSTKIPAPQFLLGWYLGYLTQKNEWQISEGVFIHTWWDVIAINMGYLLQTKKEARESNSMLRLPTLEISF
jgi:membrane protease YdiL (CAAX protease family)